MKHPVIFTHPQMANDLVVSIQPDEITWAYGLNTAEFSTYGGEVMQILSVFFDDMEIKGTIKTYAEMESIYSWFVQYMQIASAGFRGQGSYDMRPVHFIYEHRGWEFDIYPRQLPTFRYGTQVVAPTWNVIAAVAEPEPALSEAILTQAQLDAEVNGAFTTFGLATAEIGFKENNPFNTPPTGEDLNKAIEDLSGVFSSLTSGDWSGIEASKPPGWATGKKQVKSGSTKGVLSSIAENVGNTVQQIIRHANPYD